MGFLYMVFYSQSLLLLMKKTYTILTYTKNSYRKKYFNSLDFLQTPEKKNGSKVKWWRLSNEIWEKYEIMKNHLKQIL